MYIPSFCNKICFIEIALFNLQLLIQTQILSSLTNVMCVCVRAWRTAEGGGNAYKYIKT
jgi:hypothetical protein